MLNLQLDKSLIRHVDEACVKYADRVCFISDSVHTTYKEIQEGSCKVANQLIAEGFKKGMRGAVMSLNATEAFIALLGIIRAGGIWVPVNPRNSISDNLALMEKFGCHAIFYQDKFATAVGQIKELFPELLSLVCLNVKVAEAPLMSQWCQSAESTDPAVPAEAEDIVCIPMTGGTTGLPKAVALTNQNLAAIMEGIGYTLDLHKRESVWLLVAPMTHVGGRLCLMAMQNGGKNVLLPEFTYQGILDAIAKERVTDLFLPPTAIYKLLDLPGIEKSDFSSLYNIGYGSAPILIERLKEAISVFGPVMQGGYGQTEAPTSISFLTKWDHFADGDLGGELAPDARLRSVGKPSAICEAAIMDEAGNLLPAGEKGEIVVKGPFVSKGYYKNPEATAKMRRNGWHLTGDIGKIDEDGYIYILDRKKDMIITGGFNVYPNEVEQTIVKIPGIKEVACFGIPDSKWGEKVHACVISDGTSITEEEVIAFCKAELGSVKSPKSISFEEDFPKNSNGKVLKRQMRAVYWESHEKKI